MTEPTYDQIRGRVLTQLWSDLEVSKYFSHPNHLGKMVDLIFETMAPLITEPLKAEIEDLINSRNNILREYARQDMQRRRAYGKDLEDIQEDAGKLLEKVLGLRESLTEAEAVIIRAQAATDTSQPIWWPLDDYDGSMDSLKVLIQERDDALHQVKKLQAEIISLQMRNARLASTCTCATSYEVYEGPEVDCAVHGAIQALNAAMAELVTLRRQLAGGDEGEQAKEDLRES